jgi:hypothetical protein
MSGFNLYRAQAEAVIQQAGERVQVERDEGGGVDRFGSHTPTWLPIGNEAAVFYYQKTRGRESSNVSGGWTRSEEARLMFRRASIIEEDDRVTIPSTGRTYRVDAIQPYPTHKEATLIALSDHE